VISSLRIVALTSFILAGVAGIVNAQIIPGLPVNAPQISVPLGSISPLTENVHLEIPIASNQQRGDDPMMAKFVYDSVFGVNPNGSAGAGHWSLQFGAARAGTVGATYTSGPCPDPNYPNGSTSTATNFYFEDSSYTIHYASTSLSTYHVNCTDAYGNQDPNVGLRAVGVPQLQMEPDFI